MILVAMKIVSMASRGRGRKGRPQYTGQTPPVFDKQAFDGAIGITAAAIAQAGIAGRQEDRQEDPSNLQRFRTYILRHSQGKRSDGGRPLVHTERESVRGYGDYL